MEATTNHYDSTLDSGSAFWPLVCRSVFRPPHDPQDPPDAAAVDARMLRTKAETADMSNPCEANNDNSPSISTFASAESAGAIGAHGANRVYSLSCKWRSPVLNSELAPLLTAACNANSFSGFSLQRGPATGYDPYLVSFALKSVFGPPQNGMPSIAASASSITPTNGPA
ncbi:hypothetical protein V502_02114 [Pseudogymnoascus sp. VKM F-4520 (FW-2644)]|nr:hypothetical protein V502_02114 [Pseudogymnoascus sp. VKM F-4520 (FW-2644)]